MRALIIKYSSMCSPSFFLLTVILQQEVSSIVASLPTPGFETGNNQLLTLLITTAHHHHRHSPICGFVGCPLFLPLQTFTPRFYRAVYRCMLHPDLYDSSKQSLFLNVVYKTLKTDADLERVLVSSTAVHPSMCFLCKAWEPLTIALLAFFTLAISVVVCL